MKNKNLFLKTRLLLMILSLMVLGVSFSAEGAIDGVISSSNHFTLTAKSGYIDTPEGGHLFTWGYALNNANMQYPGPTLLLKQNDVVTVTLKNELTVPVSIVFPGQPDVAATGGVPGLLTMEAPPGGTVDYMFTASQPGTYTYYSGTMPELQVEMGLVGAIIVRPSTNPSTQAYNHASSAYDREFLYLLTEMDPEIHRKVSEGRMNEVDTTTFFPVNWFINGRSLPDTLLEAPSLLLPSQPYNIVPRMRVGERVLVRMIGGGRDFHPLHLHGNHHKVIARDARLLESTPGTSGADLAEMLFSTTVASGQTTDAIFTWTGENLGWDLYGHSFADPLVSNETFAETTLLSSLSSNAFSTSLTVADASGFPATSSFRAIVWSGTFPGTTREIVRLKRSFGNTFTITGRGLEMIPLTQGNVEASNWPSGSRIAYTDHGRPVPVKLPDQLDLTNGMFWSGSPFLGTAGPLPPGEGGFNPNSGFFFMWHSHSEKELTNNNVFPGGLASMMIVEHPDPLIAPFADNPNITVVP
ncbi:MAG: multicopper oxidase family protein [Nitrospirae bacterium]|nr:multicopper oxidase family protein [Nitrospirota bacterium]